MMGEERAIFITDGMSATGIPNGTYTLGDFPVEVKDGVCISRAHLLAARSLWIAPRRTSRVLPVPRLASRFVLPHEPGGNGSHSDLTRIAPGLPANFNL